MQVQKETAESGCPYEDGLFCCYTEVLETKVRQCKCCTGLVNKGCHFMEQAETDHRSSTELHDVVFSHHQHYRPRACSAWLTDR